MLAVLKWPVPVLAKSAPIGGGRVLHVGIDPGTDDPAVWTLEFMQDDRTVATPYYAACFATGQPLHGNVDDHLGTAIAPSGHVWHVMRVRR